MKELNLHDIEHIHGAKFKFKFHFNPLYTFFTAVGAFIVTGPVGAGVVIASAIATQGTGQLVDMAKEQQFPFGQNQW